MKQTYKAKRIITFALILSILAVLSPSEVHAKIFTETQTSVKIKIEAMGQYINWDGVSNVSQFLDEKGELCFAFDNGKYVSVVKTKNGKPASKDIKLKKKSSIFGAVTCDKNGNLLPDKERLNKYGRWLRRTSCDELLELINILTGDMSIVGGKRYNSNNQEKHSVFKGCCG